ncbi:copper chaperone PCu(A)C [Aliidiomarina quisquiliarum]|uniref:copper chaperone PCu(A)C n=1 Tax=Aliidiomarina quisquiliarum TaxID=2938947 RepID=UPI00208FAF49|nr:copper chaperone PCu(A)C [Aliidiomarina quisquiliarum]MCO4322593.1 copper chaperone PCu(A)C [Aliidiomarina quisquiliarum]
MRKLMLTALILSFFVSPIFAADIEVEGLWLRETIPGQPHGAGFGKLRNNTEFDMFLIGGSISVAEDVEIHQHVIEGEQMRMEQIEALMVPAQAHVRLQPGGYHVMLMNLKQPLVTGDVYDLTLIFSDGSTVVVPVPVQSLVQNHSHHNH